jgi:hypothetical protein
VSDLVRLIEWGGIGSFIVILAFIWACERVITGFINRNKPATDCERDCECDCDEEPEDGDDVVVMGGQVEDTEEGVPPTSRSRS